LLHHAEKNQLNAAVCEAGSIGLGLITKADVLQKQRVLKPNIQVKKKKMQNKNKIRK
jgi:hypothetical protein